MTPRGLQDVVRICATSFHTSEERKPPRGMDGIAFTIVHVLVPKCVVPFVKREITTALRPTSTTRSVTV
jgi:hypothetical protein